MSAHYAILGATGVDRPGLLDEISQFLLERGGKIEDIRVANLSGQFAFLARIGGSEAALAQITQEIGNLAHASHIHADLHPHRGEHSTSGDGFPFRFSASGNDQAVAMQRISHLMRVLNINIDDIKTRAAQNGHFELELRLLVPRETPVTMLRDYLRHLCGEMQVQWNLDPA
jgi:glycine cleavage system transcriptional repressor